MAKKNTTPNTSDIAEAMESLTLSESTLVDNGESAKEVEVAPVAAAPEETPRAKRERSHKYVAARSMIDRTISYDVNQAIELAQRSAYTKFDGTLTLHLNLKKEIKPVDVSMPFSTGKAVRVATVTDEVVSELEAGQINFDVLIATPDTMKKIVKFARLLGPRGLMPNPKNGTITTDPDAKRAELEKGSINLKSEKKAPLVHVRVGKQRQAVEEVAANVDAIFKAVGAINIVKATIAPTMGPGVKIKVVV